MKESELLKYENNINIVCAESGMGKTELMKSVKNKSCYKSWTIMIYARNHSQHFKEKKDDVNAFKKYIVDRIYKRYEEFELQFLKMLIIDTR
jgi:predicted ATP-binding protein involved in virulence